MNMSSNSPQVRPANKPLVLDDQRQHLLLCASGSVATIKIPLMIKALSGYPYLSIRLILTTSAAAFLAGQAEEQPSLSAIAELPNVEAIYLDEDEWAKPWVRGDKILHIELRRWADIMVVAPLSANSLAKVAGGICDNLLLSTFRAWDTTGLKIIIVAPAMNTAMWLHPITQKHVKLLQEEWSIEQGGWIELLKPVEKEIACGDVGIGGMREWREIVEVIESRMRLKNA
ncbi:flavo protein [Pseudovirgaria hyperparasitica]|uniref:Flavo protein n=1 Tax=Pseudovirgaria hyperparasitica TaxID=470096 RepID=A0A6A6WBT0_9PEZI|nr:flavo protein [Pseudovirgaria hyperparasitica]KAF2759494.1 flavo protein [Pseudovirgaria hyperparasitica]